MLLKLSSHSALEKTECFVHRVYTLTAVVWGWKWNYLCVLALLTCLIQSKNCSSNSRNSQAAHRQVNEFIERSHPRNTLVVFWFSNSADNWFLSDTLPLTASSTQPSLWHKSLKVIVFVPLKRRFVLNLSFDLCPRMFRSRLLHFALPQADFFLAGLQFIQQFRVSAVSPMQINGSKWSIGLFCLMMCGNILHCHSRLHCGADSQSVSMWIAIKFQSNLLSCLSVSCTVW